MAFAAPTVTAIPVVPPEAGAQTDFLSKATSAAPLIQALFKSGDATENVEVLRAKIKNAESMKRKIPALAFFYDNEIRKFRGKLKAALSAQKLQSEGVASTRSWRVLGQTGVVVGLLVGITLIAVGLNYIRSRK